MSALDSEDDQDDSDEVTEFEATPAFKRRQPVEPMMITRSQKKPTQKKSCRKRTARQAGFADAVIMENEESGELAAVRETRSTRKRRNA